MNSEESTVRSLIKESSDLKLRALTRGVSPLAAPFFSVSSLAIPQTAYRVELTLIRSNA